MELLFNNFTDKIKFIEHIQDNEHESHYTFDALTHVPEMSKKIINIFVDSDVMIEDFY